MASGGEGPVPEEQLQKITKESCDTVLSAATCYIHSETESWNTAIINRILEALISTSQPTTDFDDSDRLEYKYAVNSTIIQHLSDPVPSSRTTNTLTTVSTGTSTTNQNGTSETQTASPPTTPEPSNAHVNGVNGSAAMNGSGGGAAQSAPHKGRRGMHSATGAYWNNETDGMWSYKWEGGEKKGMDVVVNLLWIAI